MNVAAAGLHRRAWIAVVAIVLAGALSTAWAEGRYPEDADGPFRTALNRALETAKSRPHISPKEFKSRLQRDSGGVLYVDGVYIAGPDLADALKETLTAQPPGDQPIRITLSHCTVFGDVADFRQGIEAGRIGSSAIDHRLDLQFFRCDLIPNRHSGPVDNSLNFSGELRRVGIKESNSFGYIDFGQANVNKVDFNESDFWEAVQLGGAQIESLSSLGDEYHDAVLLQSLQVSEALWDGDVFDSGITALGVVVTNRFALFQTKVTGNLVLSGAKLQQHGGISIHDSTLSGGDVFLDGIKADSMQAKPDVKTPHGARDSISVVRTSLNGRLYLDYTSVSSLAFISGDSHDGSVGSVVALGPESTYPFKVIAVTDAASFVGLRCKVCQFDGVEFQDAADFSNMRVGRFLQFNFTRFNGLTSFAGTQFPPIATPRIATGGQASTASEPTGTTFDGSTFRQGAELEWRPLAESFHSDNPATWRQLGAIFGKNADLDGSNAIQYEIRVLEGSAPCTEPAGRGIPCALGHFADGFQRVLWGYGYRPLRLALWMTLLWLLFTGVYYTQTAGLRSGASFRPAGWVERAAYAAQFSWKTSVGVLFGVKNSRTPLFQALTLIQGLLFKALGVLLLASLSTVSPLLHDLVGKLLPL